MSLLKKILSIAVVSVATLSAWADDSIAVGSGDSDFVVESYVPGPNPATQPEAFVTTSDGFLWSLDAWKDVFVTGE
jgi:hypothetical protein